MGKDKNTHKGKQAAAPTPNRNKKRKNSGIDGVVCSSCGKEYSTSLGKFFEHVNKCLPKFHRKRHGGQKRDFASLTNLAPGYVQTNCTKKHL